MPATMQPVTPSQQQTREVRQWRPIDKNLRKLHRRGLNGRVDDLDALLAVARVLSPKPTDLDRIEDTLARAIDKCWTRVLRDAMRLWFGLPALEAENAPDTRAMTSTERHAVASAHAGEKESTFRTSAAQTRYEVLAKKLVELAENPADAPPAPEQPDLHDNDESPVYSEGFSVGDEMTLMTWAWQLIRRRPMLTVLYVTCLFAVGYLGAFWFWPTPSESTNLPEESIVNTWTGHAHLASNNKPPEGTTATVAGGNIIEACDLTKNRCLLEAGTTIRARLGDTIQFRIRLHDTAPMPIPFLRVSADWSGGFNSNAFTLTVAIRWPNAHGHLTEASAIHPVRILLPKVGKYWLAYDQDSTTLQGGEQDFNLSEGLLLTGIGLEDLGPPPSCFNECDTGAYTRFIVFRMHIIPGGEYPITMNELKVFARG